MKKILFRIKKIIFYDSLKSQEAKKSSPDKQYKISRNNYTIISAVYNVDKYLEDYFRSLIVQSLSFKDHIHLVLVDDGSTDNSADIIRKWQKRFPDNITYIRKENGGQASARNLGMEYAKTEWITFIDPDDFLDYKYFEVVDSFLGRNKDNNIGLVSCNFIFYYEGKNWTKDTHALKYRFREEEKIVNPSNMEGFIQLTVNSVFFRRSLLEKKQIKFQENIRPNFEDGHYVNLYLIENADINIAFLKNAKYFYRKRSDGTSTLDSSWTSIGKFSDVLSNGYLDILKYALNKFGKVPLYLQRTILYDLMWHLKLFMNNSHKLGHLTDEQRKKYISLIEEIFQYIDTDTIVKFELAGIWLSDKVGLLGRFKQSEPPYHVCHIDNYDKTKHEMRLHYFYYFECSEQFLLDGKVAKTHFEKVRVHDFGGEVFLYEKIVWLPLKESTRLLNVQLGDIETRIVFAGVQYNHDYEIQAIINHFEGKNGIDDTGMPNEYRFYRNIYLNQTFDKFKNAWLLMDRDIQADDNAEHLYRYIRKNHPKINTYFMLRKTSRDWERLEKEGFRLIEFDTEEHAVALLRADHLISSQADHYITDYLPKRWFSDLLKSKFTFLQHGVILHDLSNWLNSKEIDCFITTSPREYDSICGNLNHYKFTKKEVVLTGLPRHDTLLLGKDKKEKMILIMPTWRQHLVGTMTGMGNTRSINENFGETLYVKEWKGLLHSKKLKKLSQDYGYKVIFYPHANIQPYLDIFDIPKYIETLSEEIGSIQTLFQRAALMITDYSSVAFEMGILHRECIYYQFDYEEVFAGEHTTKEGYFSYQEDGFGPVCYNKKEVLGALEKFLESGGEVEGKYLERMESFFAFHDTDNCQRVFEAIESLD